MAGGEGWTTTRLREDHCPNCGKRLDAASAPGDRGPKPGDCTICVECVHVAIYGDDLRLRNPTDAEVIELAGDQELKAHVNAVASAKKHVEETGGMRSREEHLTWAKERALAYLDRGRLSDAVASMGSDLNKHPGTSGQLALMLVGMMCVVEHDFAGARRWINGFR